MALRSGTELINPFRLLEYVGVRPGAHVADLGCGALGHFVFPAAQLVGAGGIVYAVDIQKPVLERIAFLAKEEQAFNVKPVWSDIDVYGATKIPDGSLDVTLVVNNLFLSQNRDGLVREAARLTRVGGRVVIVEWKDEWTPIGPPRDHRMPLSEIQQIFDVPFLTCVDAFEAGEYHDGLIYQRIDAPIEE